MRALRQLSGHASAGACMDIIEVFASSGQTAEVKECIDICEAARFPPEFYGDAYNKVQRVMDLLWLRCFGCICKYSCSMLDEF
eukprot:m.149397 g.149397  ORF g.149397 m.149397 type:complete len:83 (-) comp10131_c0_seq8:1416-1664(-)